MLTASEIELPAPLEYEARRGAPIRQILWRVAFWCIILNVAVGAVVAGLVLRRYAWDQTEPIRFTTDIDNAFFQGSATLRQGYIARYTNQDINSDDYEFDYAPGRLMVATLWARWVRRTVDGPNDPLYVTEWPRSFYNAAREMPPRPGWGKGTSSAYYLCRPLMIVNNVGEIISAVAMFLLVRQWTSGSRRPGIFSWPQARPMRSAVLGLIAALFFWFNLALIWNAHCWPQWDSWVLPFFLWAFVFASADYWVWAGVLIAAGAMFKAQILFGAPIFVLWPLWRGKWLAIVRWCVGVTAATAVMTAVWLLRNDDQMNKSAVYWVVGNAVAIAALWWAVKPRFGRYIRAGLAAVAVVLVIWPLVHMGWVWLLGSVLAMAGAGALFHFRGRTVLPYTAAAWVGIALFCCVPIFNGSMAWYHVGIAYGTHHYNELARGSDDNLAGILQKEWGWDIMDTVFTVPAGRTANWVGGAIAGSDPRFGFERDHPLNVPLKYVLLSVYVVASLLCSWGAAYQSKRGSARFLVAIAAQWIAFFAVMGQMHQRYLLWGASLSAATVVLGPGFLLLHLLVTVIAWSQEAADMLGRSGYRQNNVYTIISGWTPGIGWALLLCAAIFIYVAVTPGRKRV